MICLFGWSKKVGYPKISTTAKAYRNFGTMRQNLQLTHLNSRRPAEAALELLLELLQENPDKRRSLRKGATGCFWKPAACGRKESIYLLVGWLVG